MQQRVCIKFPETMTWIELNLQRVCIKFLQNNDDFVTGNKRIGLFWLVNCVLQISRHRNKSKTGSSTLQVWKILCIPSVSMFESFVRLQQIYTEETRLSYSHFVGSSIIFPKYGNIMLFIITHGSLSPETKFDFIHQDSRLAYIDIIIAKFF